MRVCGIIGGVKTYQTLLFAFAIFAAFAESQPFDRYQSIIDRKPFGPEPVDFDPEAAPGTASAAGAAGAGEMTPEQRTAEEQNLASKVRVSILNKAPDGSVKVGFTDSSANPPENYYLKVGGSQTGWTVKSAEPATESVTLEKDGVEVTMKLGEGPGGKGGANAIAKGGALKRGVPPLFGGPKDNNKEVGGRLLPLTQLGGVARLRQQRIELARKQQEEAERKREADAAAKAAQDEREAREREEKQLEAEERRQQREAMLQLQEQFRKRFEERAAERQSQQEEPE